MLYQASFWKHIVIVVILTREILSFSHFANKLVPTISKVGQEQPLQVYINPFVGSSSDPCKHIQPACTPLHPLNSLFVFSASIASAVSAKRGYTLLG
jgi:hypothetical protein